MAAEPVRSAAAPFTQAIPKFTPRAMKTTFAEPPADILASFVKSEHQSDDLHAPLSNARPNKKAAPEGAAFCIMTF
ncbi:hypothetical protein GCM10007866_30020 [Gluconobacter albidus]|uniref:Uncharacterized protein n=1 Tax=Gluconobacter albidus TaxID=318683 RepID=A0ABQ5X487_9PROT|nr:hypothetical protein AA3250_0254 [Gluconobacter albidus NBRC 3250]GLQ70549.1 hypothetical protein GCM10007866_30020 [Gluconobacter albidus]